MATFKELIGTQKTGEEISREIGVDSLHYQDIEDFLRASGFDRNQLCLGCTTREYPTPFANKLINKRWERFCSGFVEKKRIYE